MEAHIAINLQEAAADEGPSFLMTAKQLYNSLPVPSESRCIRVLDLDAETSSKAETESLTLSGTLRVTNLDHSPQFTCLSYAWGDRDHLSHKITCQGCDIQISENCHSALWHIGKQFGNVAIWIDSICINQADDDEKTSQLDIMGDIYSFARSVYIWLGPGNEESDNAVGFLQRKAVLGRRIPLSLVTASSTKRKRQDLWGFNKQSLKDMCCRLKRTPQPVSWAEVEKLLDCQWAHRSWTFQELILARDPIFVCGFRTLLWEDIISAICLKDVEWNFWEPSASSIVIANWRSMIDFWLNFPRADPGDGSQRSIKEEIIQFWEVNGDLCTLTKAISRVSNTLMISVFAALLYLTYCGFASQKREDGGDSIAYAISNMLLLAFPFCIIMPLLFYTSNMIIKGRKHSWVHDAVVHGHSASGTARVLDGIRAALRERESYLPHDKSFALGGILSSCGASPTKPNYLLAARETYQILFQDLLDWDPSALILLLDAGGRTPCDSLSWVPNWEVPISSQWISSRYRLGLNESATPSKDAPTFTLSGTSLILKGQRIGKITFRTDASETNCFGYESLCLTLLQLWRWLRTMEDNSERPGALKLHTGPSSLFAVLEAQSVERRPKLGTVEILTPSDQNAKEQRPDWEVPQKYASNLYGDYSDFKELEIIITTSQLFSTLPQGGIHDASSLFAVVSQSPPALKYLKKLAERLSTHGRCLFTLSTSNIGTGPLETQLGDEVFLLAGVPSPMTLRRTGRGNTFRVVGASLVHGIMHGEKFHIGNLVDVTLV